MTALNYASLLNYHELVKFLLESGASAEIVNNSRYSPLINAASRGNIRVVLLLIEEGIRAKPLLEINEVFEKSHL